MFIVSDNMVFSCMSFVLNSDFRTSSHSDLHLSGEVMLALLHIICFQPECSCNANNDLQWPFILQVQSLTHQSFSTDQDSSTFTNTHQHPLTISYL